MVNTTTVNIENSILWGNTSGSGNNIYISTACTTNVDYSLYGNEAGDINVVSGGALNASNCLTTDPNFTDAIAPTGLNTPNLNGDYTLESTSSAIDAGSNPLVPEALTTDLAGNDRIIDGDENSTATVDMGAYEYDPSEVPLPILLTEFSAVYKNGVVHLSWSTASETDNASFLIYRNSVSIATIEGAGTSSEPHAYSFVDNTVIPQNTYTYMLADVSYANQEVKHSNKSVTLTIGENDVFTDFVLHDNYPNPFNPQTTINYSLSQNADVIITVFDMKGSKITTLVNDNLSAGNYETTWDATEFNSGVYFYRLTAGNFVQTKKMVLMK